jgi:hypothetical protein
VFSAPHGSVCDFRVEGEQVRPVFADFPFEAVRWAYAEAMQAGALQFVEDYAQVWRGQPLPEVPPAAALRFLHAALLDPTGDEARLLGDLQHAEGFGKVAVTRYIAKPEGALWNPFSYPALLRGYRDAFWRIGYKKRLLGSLSDMFGQ